MELSLFDYDLPETLIAQTPAEPRDSSRLLHLDRATGAIEHQHFRNIVDYLEPEDVLVLNDTRVIPARIAAHKAETGGKVEILLLRQLDDINWRVLIGGRNVLEGTLLNVVEGELSARVVEVLDGSERIIEFNQPISTFLEKVGEMPLPPYIHTKLSDAERYQTIYSRYEGSAAAPTAGLHFTPELLVKIRDKGVKLAYCTLHVGLDTFQPVHEEIIEEHKIHSERASLNATNANIINEAKLKGGRIIAVGTTSARTLETAGILSERGDPARPFESVDACPWRPVTAFEDSTELFIYPGYRWRVVDAMITNFHLPKSTLLMMISAFASREAILNTYEIAKQEGYRFYSFGDAMFIT